MSGNTLDRAIDTAFVCLYAASILLVVWVAVAGFWGGHRAEAATIRFLRKQEFTHINLRGQRWFTCDEYGGTFATYFKATAKDGQETSGEVCSNWINGHSTLWRGAAVLNSAPK